MKKLFLSAVLALAGLCMGAAHAQAQRSGDIELTNIAEMEVSVKTPDGKVEKKRQAVEKAIPGSEIIYTTTFRNVGKRVANSISIVNPVPANTTLVGGSSYGEQTEIAFSADGGKTWASADKVKVAGADGKQRPAGISEFTHIRWNYKGELAPGKQGAVGFRVTVN
ncbi:MAG TPA: hypothetical protein VFM98_19265 [Ramlibacter sp.]|uniref:hypothetical protein n=1 Tax=Ramlibacter sp. TaxID=1917967 RepID=UPI002D80A22F|nr:hypothetical protein [Ramlibacter sp.]HET8747748.1 hypothetical protein [Ramlibacter sp.]